MSHNRHRDWLYVACLPRRRRPPRSASVRRGNAPTTLPANYAGPDPPAMSTARFLPRGPDGLPTTLPRGSC